MHAHRGLDEGDGADAANLNLLVGMVLILAHKADITLLLRLLDILYGDVLLAIHIYRQEIHIAPKYIPNTVKLLIQYNIATLYQWIHRVTYNIYRTIALWQVRDMDMVDGLNIRIISK